MPSTHQQLLYHVVFNTKNRKPYLANEDRRTRVFAYMAGTVKNLEGFALEIGGWVAMFTCSSVSPRKSLYQISSVDSKPARSKTRTKRVA